jgi:hypothetical protein
MYPRGGYLYATSRDLEADSSGMVALVQSMYAARPFDGTWLRHEFKL